VTDFAFLPDDAVVPARKDGVLTLLRDGNVGEQPFLDISGRANIQDVEEAIRLEVRIGFHGQGSAKRPVAYGEGAPQDDGPKAVRLPYLEDVGGDLREEVDVAPKGANLGWLCYEGQLRQPQFARSRSAGVSTLEDAPSVEFPLYAYATADPASRSTWVNSGGSAARMVEGISVGLLLVS
jgi:hypothetical protein